MSIFFCPLVCTSIRLTVLFVPGTYRFIRQAAYRAGVVTVGRKATQTKVMNVMSKWPEFSYVSITMFLTNLAAKARWERVSYDYAVVVSGVVVVIQGRVSCGDVVVIVEKMEREAPGKVRDGEGVRNIAGEGRRDGEEEGTGEGRGGSHCLRREGSLRGERGGEGKRKVEWREGEGRGGKMEEKDSESYEAP